MNLGTLFVEIVAKGAQAAVDAIRSVGDAAKSASLSISELSRRLASLPTTTTVKVGLDIAESFTTVSDSVTKTRKEVAEYYTFLHEGGQGTANSLKLVGHEVTESSKRSSSAMRSSNGLIMAATQQMASTFAKAALSLAGFVTLSMAGTVEGSRLQWQIQMLGRSIGALFLPVIEAAISKLSAMTKAVQSLTLEQAKLIAQFTTIVGGLGMMVSGIAPVIGAVSILAGLLIDGFDNANGSVNGMTNAFLSMGKAIEWVINPIRIIFHGIVSGIGGIGLAISKVGEWVSVLTVKISNLTGAMLKFVTLGKYGWGAAEVPDFKYGSSANNNTDRQKMLTQQAGGFESLTATYSRIQQNIVNQWDPARAHEQAQELRQKTNEHLEKVFKVLLAMQPGLAA